MNKWTGVLAYVLFALAVIFLGRYLAIEAQAESRGAAEKILTYFVIAAITPGLLWWIVQKRDDP